MGLIPKAFQNLREAYMGTTGKTVGKLSKPQVIITWAMLECFSIAEALDSISRTNMLYNIRQT